MSPVFLPPPAKVVAAVGRLVTQGYVDSTLFQHALASLGRVFFALVFTVLIGVPGRDRDRREPVSDAAFSIRSSSSSGPYRLSPICRW